jgi:hypothetical protein
MSESRGYFYHNVEPAAVFRFSGNFGKPLPLPKESDPTPSPRSDVPIVAIVKRQRQLEARVAELEKLLKEKEQGPN